MKTLYTQVGQMNGKQVCVDCAVCNPLDYCNPNNEYSMHDFIEMELWLSGSGSHVINSVPFEIKHGLFYIVMPGEYHKYLLHAEPRMEMLNMKVAPDLPSREILARLKSMSYPHAVYFSEAMTDVLKREIWLLKEVAESEEDSMMLKNIVDRIILYMTREYQDVSADIRENIPMKLKVVSDYVEAHYSEKITVKDAAALVDMRESYFSVFFHRSTNIPFCDFVNRIRLQHAIRLMTNTGLSIKEISKKTGFSSPEYFSRCFRKHFGSAPSKYLNNSENIQ